MLFFPKKSLSAYTIFAYKIAGSLLKNLNEAAEGLICVEH